MTRERLTVLKYPDHLLTHLRQDVVLEHLVRNSDLELLFLDAAPRHEGEAVLVGEDQPVMGIDLAYDMVAAYAHDHTAPDLPVCLYLELSLPGRIKAHNSHFLIAPPHLLTYLKLHRPIAVLTLDAQISFTHYLFTII